MSEHAIRGLLDEVRAGRLRGIEHNVYEVDFWNVLLWTREA